MVQWHTCIESSVYAYIANSITSICGGFVVQQIHHKRRAYCVVHKSGAVDGVGHEARWRCIIIIIIM